MIANAIKMLCGLVMVFDGRGQVIPRDSGHYSSVKKRILKDAPERAGFLHENGEGNLDPVPREEW